MFYYYTYPYRPSTSHKDKHEVRGSSQNSMLQEYNIAPFVRVLALLSASASAMFDEVVGACRGQKSRWTPGAAFVIAVRREKQILSIASKVWSPTHHYLVLGRGAGVCIPGSPCVTPNTICKLHHSMHLGPIQESLKWP